VRAKLTGLHTTTKTLADGKVVIYAYAFRGGPLVAREAAGSLSQARRALEASLGSPAVLKALEAARRPVPMIQSVKHVPGLVSAFFRSPEFTRLKPTTQREYRRYLGAFEAEFREFGIDGLEVTDLTDWRDELTKHPRAADYAMQAVSRLYSWARSRGYTKNEPTKDIRSIHRANRSDAIWTAADLQRLYAKASPRLCQAVDLALLTGLRLGDLVRLTWPAVSDEAIMVRTSKRERDAVIPLFPETRALLDAIGRREIGTVLVNTRGKPWTADGLKASFRKARLAANITGLRFHDLRGTAATRLKVMGADDDMIALVMGWSKDAVQALMVRYVSADAVAVDMLRRITERTGRYKPADKPGQNEPAPNDPQLPVSIAERAPSSVG